MAGLPGRGGLPGHQALHPRWEAHHRPVAAEFFTAEVLIRRHSSDATFDPENGQSIYPDPAIVWQGMARLHRPRDAEQTRTIGDRQVVVRGAVVSLPVDAPPAQIGDEVQVLTYRDPDSGDPHLPGQPMWVHDIRPGSLLFQRDLVALTAPPTSR